MNKKGELKNNLKKNIAQRLLKIFGITKLNWRMNLLTILPKMSFKEKKEAIKALETPSSVLLKALKIIFNS